MKKKAKKEAKNDDCFRRLAQAIRDALVQGGMEPSLADSLFNLVEAVLAILPEAPAQVPLDVELDRLVTVIEVEMKRTSTNLGTILRTACRDTPSPELAARVDEIVKLHIRCELLLIETLMGMKRRQSLAEQRAMPTQN